MRQPTSKIRDAVAGMYGLAKALPDFFRERITVEAAEAEIARAVECRDATFLQLAYSLIYADPASPYHWLLKVARCEFSDLRSYVLSHGLNATLERLAREGVYLWSKEFQARVWERAGTLRVRREAPYASSRGKILPLQIQKRSE